MDLSDDNLKSNNIKQNAELLALMIEPSLQNFDRLDPNDNQLFNCYYAFLIIADKLEKITSLLAKPTNIIEYVYYYYAIYILGTSEKPVVVNEKLKNILASNQTDLFSKSCFTIILNLQTGQINSKDFLTNLEGLYNRNLGFFLKNSTFTTTFMRLYIPLLINSTKFVTIINQWYDFSKKLELEFSRLILSHLMGMITGYAGKLETAREFNLESLKISTRLNYINQFATKNNLGTIYTAIGNYEKAGEIYQELLKRQPRNSIFLLNLSDNYLNLKEYEKGLEIITNYEKTIEPLKNTNNNLALESKFNLLLRLHKLEEALVVEKEANNVENLGPLITTNKLVYNRMLATRYQYEGNFSLAKQQMDEVLKLAEELNRLHELFENYIKLIEIQLDLVIMRPNFQEYKNQLFSLIDMLIKLSGEQNLIYQKINLLVLRSEVFKHFNLMIEANKDLEEAKTLAKEKDYDDLFNKILFEMQKLRKNEVNVKEKEKTSSNFLKRIKDALNVLKGSPLTSDEIKKIDYTLHGILILTDSGLSIFQYRFSDLLESDPNLISGLILAITTFMTELSKGKGILKSITHDNLSLILEPMEQFICVSISSLECFEIREKTRKFAMLSRKIVLENEKDIAAGILYPEMIGKLQETVKLVF